MLEILVIASYLHKCSQDSSSNIQYRIVAIRKWVESPSPLPHNMLKYTSTDVPTVPVRGLSTFRITKKLQSTSFVWKCTSHCVLTL